MRFEIGALIKAAIADRAFMRRFFEMENFVDGQCARLTKSFATFHAFEWFLFWMNVSGGWIFCVKDKEKNQKEANKIIKWIWINKYDKGVW